MGPFELRGPLLPLITSETDCNLARLDRLVSWIQQGEKVLQLNW